MVIGVGEAQLQPDFWIRRLSNADRTVLDAQAIAAQNERLHRLDPSFHDIEQLPQTLSAAQVRGWIENLSARPEEPMYDAQGQALDAPTLDALVRSTNLHSIPQNQPTRYGLVVRRADLRTFPTHFRAFTSNDDTDIDRFQESAMFPGTPVAIVHESEDRAWWFVVSPLYAAWVEKSTWPEGTARAGVRLRGQDPLSRHHRRQGAHRVHARATGGLRTAAGDGRRVPLLADWPASQAGQWPASYSSQVIELPLRGADGALRFAPALLPKTNDTAPRLSAADARQPAAPELQVSRRTLRLGPLLQRARLQRLRLRGLPQLGRAAAAQHARPGRQPRARRIALRADSDTHAAARMAALRERCRSATWSTSPAT